jgi:isoleucyl-tRNA synthetase
VNAAFETLYECLYALVRLAAPIIPFLTEKIFQNLVRSTFADAPLSVHLTAYPQLNDAWRDDSLTEEMRAIMRLNTLALSAREERKLKVRQPLATLTIGPRDAVEKRAAERFREMLGADLNVKEVRIADLGSPSPVSAQVKPNFKTLGPRVGKNMKAVAAAIEAQATTLAGAVAKGESEFSVLVDGEKFRLTPDDLLVNKEPPAHLAVAEDYGTWVAFDTTLTEELRLEGTMRDLLRRLQMLRKEVGLEIEDRIHIAWHSDAKPLVDVFARWESYLADELLCVRMTRETAKPPGADGSEIDVAGSMLWIKLTRAAAPHLPASP